MKSSLRLLSWFIFAATIGTSAFGGPNEDVLIGSKAGVGRESPILLAGANGHDSVGGLMPLPLWPSVAVAHGAVPAKSGKRRSRRCCGIMRSPGRAAQQ